jgi:tRNA (guanine37-N1)-methyltransferase
MRIDIITVLPALLHGPFEDSILKRARQQGIIEVNIHNLRDYSTNKHRQVDDYQYGGGAGMVLAIEPIASCIRSLSAKCTYDQIIYMTPDGETLRQPLCNRLSLSKNLLILCGHYKGIDQRVRDHFVTLEVSIGDYVLSGGELAAAVLVDSVARLIPGVMNDETSALTDSFQDGLLAPPVYTRPEDFEGMRVPGLLLSGNPEAVETWRMDQAILRTRQRRPDILPEHLKE